MRRDDTPIMRHTVVSFAKKGRPVTRPCTEAPSSSANKG